LGAKNQFPTTFNWQSTNPQTGFLPGNSQYSGGSKPSGVLTGAMASTNTIYSNIIERSRMDNHMIELSWTGTPTGTITVLVSNSGLNWPSLTFTPAFSQPSGSAAFEGLNISMLAAKYIMLSYVNSSGSGSLSAFLQSCDIN
jgi:hypothetical protein